MNYPTIKQVEEADHIQICRWHRFLASPNNIEEEKILDLIYTRYKEFGGMNPVISKFIGWKHQ